MIPLAVEMLSIRKPVATGPNEPVYASLTIAVMGCRVNGPGETDDADLGLWCGPTHVNLKRKTETLGAYTYDEILPRLREALDAMIFSAAPK